MKIGILVSSDVAKFLVAGFLNKGHEVMLRSRDPRKLTSWAHESGKSASSGTFSMQRSSEEL